MSYLSALRLHFSGQFEAKVSTVNNTARHFDVDKFDPKYQNAATARELLGGWNPHGDASFRLINCKIKSAYDKDGELVINDPILGAAVGDTHRRVPAKMVDLDPQQQLGSYIYGLEMRIGEGCGADWLRAQFEPSGFFAAWTRTVNGTNNETGGAAYHSVLKELEWLEPSGSAWLQSLKEAAALEGNELSIKFNLDGFDVTPTSPTFCRGRIVGTIGVAKVDEPRHFLRGRHLLAETVPSKGYPTPAGPLFNCVAVIDRVPDKPGKPGGHGKIRIDLGNSLPVLRPGGGPIRSLNTLSLIYPSTQPGKTNEMILEMPAPIKTGDYTGHYETRGGIFDLPGNTVFTKAELDAIDAGPLAIRLTAKDGTSQIVLRETPGGLYVQADQSAHRMSSGDRILVPVYAMRYGLPLVGARVLALYDQTLLQAAPGDPPVGEPEDALQFKTEIKTEANGHIAWEFEASNPGQRRKFIDGQVYGVRFALAQTLQVVVHYPFDYASIIHFLVWDDYPNPATTWEGGIKKIFTLYANLFPMMKRMVDMSDYNEIVKRREIIAYAMTLRFDDANFMPVSRDLSPAKLAAVLAWLGQPVPPRGVPSLRTAPPAPAAQLPEEAYGQGGKSAAYARTLLSQAEQHDHF